jgi:hypothetical protein
MGLFGDERTRKILAVSLEPQTIIAMNKVIDSIGGKGNRSRWVEKVILRALKEDWQIELVKPKIYRKTPQKWDGKMYNCSACKSTFQTRELAAIHHCIPTESKIARILRDEE